jgi:hypothetical protein
MAKAKKILLLTERREIFRLRISRQHGRQVCPVCEEEVGWLTGAEAAKLSNRSEREIFRLAENSGLHFAESEDGLLMVCGRSLGSSGPEPNPDRTQKDRIQNST